MGQRARRGWGAVPGLGWLLFAAAMVGFLGWAAADRENRVLRAQAAMVVADARATGAASLPELGMPLTCGEHVRLEGGWSAKQVCPAMHEVQPWPLQAQEATLWCQRTGGADAAPAVLVSVRATSGRHATLMTRWRALEGAAQAAFDVPTLAWSELARGGDALAGMPKLVRHGYGLCDGGA